MNAPASPPGLSFDPGRPSATPRDAATVLCVREPEAGPVELFCVVRHARSGFLGGAVVFPGGKVDDGDRAPEFVTLSRGLPSRWTDLGVAEAVARAFAVAAARETLEEAGVVPATFADSPGRTADRDVVAALRADLSAGASLAGALSDRGLALELGALHPFARWVTPAAEARRFDARFFLMRLPEAQEAACDGRETTEGFWASAEEVLARFARGEVQLAPPTTRCLELLRGVATFDDALTVAAEQSLLPVCPTFLPGDPPALVLPGDPAHEIAEPRVSGPTRFVLRDGRFVSEDAPHLPSR